MEKKYLSLCEQTLESMEGAFSSFAFVKKANELGLPRFYVTNNYVNLWLRKNCHRGSSSHTWLKRDQNQSKVISSVLELPIFENEDAKNGNQLDETRCIAFLKSKGYRVLKTMEVEL